MMAKTKQWGIRVRSSGWLQTSDYDNQYQTEDVVYDLRHKAVSDAKDFNSIHKEKIYTVEEYLTDG
jgi:hypothetical protein